MLACYAARRCVRAPLPDACKANARAHIRCSHVGFPEDTPRTPPSNAAYAPHVVLTQKPAAAARLAPIAERGNLEARFRSDATFRDAVYAVFERVLTPDMVVALTYNSVFGKLWRAVCSGRQARTDRVSCESAETEPDAWPDAAFAPATNMSWVSCTPSPGVSIAHPPLWMSRSMSLTIRTSGLPVPPSAGCRLHPDGRPHGPSLHEAVTLSIAPRVTLKPVSVSHIRTRDATT